MRILGIHIGLTDAIEYVGNKIPGDKDEILVCDNGHRYPDKPWKTDARVCPVCHEQLKIHLPRGERWELKWQLFLHRFFPHRIYTPKQPGVPEGKKQWMWRGRVLRETPYKASWMEDHEDESE